MKNRAKCKLCCEIIESFHQYDYVVCKCGEISVYGGKSYRCDAKHWENFLRIDDEGNEIIPIIKDSIEEKSDEVHQTEKPNKEELLKLLDDMRLNIESLPSHAMTSSITHYDFGSLLLLLSSIFRAED